jgi:sec-independent protein translocase protein TatA
MNWDPMVIRVISGSLGTHRRDDIPPYSGDNKENSMFGIGIPELIIILVIILIIFGAGKLPEIGGGMGKAIRNFRDATREKEAKKQDKIEDDKTT